MPPPQRPVATKSRDSVDRGGGAVGRRHLRTVGLQGPDSSLGLRWGSGMRRGRRHAGFTAYVHTAEQSRYGGSELNLVVTGVRLHMPPASRNCVNIYSGCAFKAVNVSGSVSEETGGAPASYTCAGQVPPSPDCEGYPEVHPWPGRLGRSCARRLGEDRLGVRLRSQGSKPRPPPKAGPGSVYAVVSPCQRGLVQRGRTLPRGSLSGAAGCQSASE